ncbi:fructose-bisphosphate aldolase class I [Candidatus Microgenomates bacterium]|nr:MAG: fructose-bisphosphate aldolase class I [Candidatus Microgenomates bacterium]
MDKSGLENIAKKLVEGNKGILAADESFGTIEKRFKKINIDSTDDTRKAYRQMLFSTGGVEEYISGVIMFDETIKQSTRNGKHFVELLNEKGIVSGIKVDTGTVALAGFPGEKITEGIDGLRERLKEYVNLGAKFTKWRAVITIGDGIPSSTCIHANAHLLARYAALAQEAGLVPIVEPEVLMDGVHDIEQCEIVTTLTLDEVFSELLKNKVYLPGMLLKPNMVVPGKESTKPSTPEQIVEATLRTFRKSVPKDVPGIVFLSGGQTPVEAMNNLCAMNRDERHPWALSFSFGRALQDEALAAWQGKEENIKIAQEAFYARAKSDAMARKGVC